MLAHFTIYPTYFSKNQIFSLGCVAPERSAVIKRFPRLINNFLNIFSLQISDRFYRVSEEIPQSELLQRLGALLAANIRKDNRKIKLSSIFGRDTDD